jgi:FkbM family methyltransferase
MAKRSLIRRFPSREERCGTPAAKAAWRIGASLVRRRISPLSVPVVDIGGPRVRADLAGPLGLELYRYGFCDAEARILKRLLRAGDAFVDGGANVGLFALLAAEAVGPAGRVLACEPAPGTMALLRANAAENGFATLDLHEVALADAPGSASFTVFEEGAGLASFAPGATGGTEVEVTVTTLDELTAPLGGSVAVVKLDIEGAEVKAIRGASRLISEAAPILLIEVEPEHLARQDASPDDLRAELAPHGYEAYAIGDDGRLAKLAGGWVPPDPARPNLVLAPPSRADRIGPLR